MSRWLGLFLILGGLGAQAASSVSSGWRDLVTQSTFQATLKDLVESVNMPAESRRELIALFQKRDLLKRSIPTMAFAGDGLRFETDFGPLKLQEAPTKGETYLLNGRRLSVKGLSPEEAFFETRKAVDKAFGLSAFSWLLPRAHASAPGDLEALVSVIMLAQEVKRCDNGGCKPASPVDQQVLSTMRNQSRLSSFVCEPNLKAANSSYAVVYETTPKAGESASSFKPRYRVYAVDANGDEKELCSIQAQRGGYEGKRGSENHLLCRQLKDLPAKEDSREVYQETPSSLIEGNLKLPVSTLLTCCHTKGCYDKVKDRLLTPGASSSRGEAGSGAGEGDSGQK